MKTIATLAAAAVLLGSAATTEARPVAYKGKTSSGHEIKFKVAGGRMHELRAGVTTSCVAIRGSHAPDGGADLFGFRGSVRMRPHVRFKFLDKNLLYFGNVTKSHDLWIKRRGRVITGRMRVQYSYMAPSYTPGVFSIYSCLGGARFTARPTR